MRNICVFVPLMLVLPLAHGQQSGLTNVKFKGYEIYLTWKEAQSYCRERHTDLATIRSDSQLPLHGWVWIGLHRENEASPWKWSRGDMKAAFFNWKDGEPDYLQDKFCVWMDSSDRWMNDECEGKRHFMCFDEKLVLVKENKTWEEALDHCRSLGGEDPVSVFWKPSYDLATLITDDDHDYARERAQQATTDEVWTGLRFLGDGWFWVGGQPVQYQDIPSCPALGCGVLEKNSSTSFGIRACSQRRNFFCYKK